MMYFQGPEAFFEAQQHVGVVLQKQHYPSFLVSDVCHKYITTLEEDMPDGGDSMNKGKYSRTSVAQTLMSRLPRMFRTRP